MKSLGVYIFLVFILLSSAKYLSAEVRPPNYDFSLDQFSKFMPGSSLKKIQEQYGQGEVVTTKAGLVTYKFFIAHIRYKFPILIQVQSDQVLDFHARLPNYFLHNIFHQSLINRLGKQDYYNSKDEHAFYMWKNKKGVNHHYSNTCTITCFPIYYSVETAEAKNVPGYKSILSQLLMD